MNAGSTKNRCNSLEYTISTNFLFRHDTTVENGGKAPREHHPIESRGARTFEMSTLRMKNEDIASNEQICNATMDHIRKYTKLPIELLTGMFFSWC